MRADRLRRLGPIALSLTFLIAASWLTPASQGVAFADDPAKPAQKDSSTRAKPKDVTLKATIEPAQAKSGDTVQLKIQATLSDGWHIYKQAEKQEGDGPRNTIFDLFDTAGLKVTGDWKPSKQAESQVEPFFNNQVFEFFEDEVTWSIPLEIPADAAPGQKAVRVQASYQICNAQSCSFPGRWTLPDAVLTIEPAGEAQETIRHEVRRPDDQAQAERKPAKKDSNLRIKPKGVTLTPSVEPAEAKPGDTVTYKIKVDLEPGLHIYEYSKNGKKDIGPVPTTFDFFDPAELTLSGDWKANHAPEARPEPAFDNQIIEFYEHEVIWSTTLQVPSDAAPGTRTLKCQAGYQICNENSCFPPGQWTLPDVTLTIKDGHGDDAAAVPPPAPAAVSNDSTPPAEPVSPPPAEPASPVAQAAARPETPTETVAAQPAEAVATTEKPVAALVDRPASSTTASDAEAKAAPAADAQTRSEIARLADQGLIPFLIASAIGGLFALAMPCVWPMVPITVNFFIKQGHHNKGKTTGLAITYCLAIIGVFTAVGVLFSFFFSASSLQKLANNPWLNLTVAGLFVAFGLSLLGLFEIRLPSFLLNVSAKGESKGGLAGVIFMALTLTITSFTCTFPVVGGLLVMAAGGNFLYPIIGLATFATVLALPFFLLALSPGLLAKMPRSGDWMNSVKVVGGLVEIGAALKFLNTAELAYVTPENAWFDASVVLTSWVALSAVCGFYLLGFFKTDHDYEDVKVGPGRMVFGTIFLGLALYMAPALFGRPPQSLVWDRLIVGILPPDSSEFNPPTLIASGATGAGTTEEEVKASSTDPAQAEREQKAVHGVAWGMSLEQAKEQAVAQNKPILIDFTGVNCANCRLMEKRVLPRPEIVTELKKFITIQLYTDFVPIASITAAQRESLAEKNQERLLDMAQEATNPFYVVLTPEGKVVSSLGGYNEPAYFQNFLKKAFEQSQGLTMADTR